MWFDQLLRTQDAFIELSMTRFTNPKCSPNKSEVTGRIGAERAAMVQRTKHHRVAWGETDAAGIVFYPNYFRWFDEATHDLIRELGYSVAMMLERGFAIPIVEAQGRFLGSLSYDDELSITSRIAEVRTRAFRVEHQVLRGEAIVCEGYEVRMWVRVSSEGGRLGPEPIPEELRTLVEPDRA